jgi:GTP cyclohydrolase I
MQDLIRQLLADLGEDPSREGLLNTPKRVEKALKFLTSGYDANLDDIVNGALFTVDYSEMVIVKDIDFYSMCEHHLLPFFGKCHVAYIPSNKVIGLSKIPRIVDVFSRRLQVQERLTNQIADTIRDIVRPLGVAVVVEATHLCMSMRGVEKQNSFAVTSAMTGVFRDQVRTRMEFLELIKLRSGVSASRAWARIDRDDATFRGSSAPRWSRCPGVGPDASIAATTPARAGSGRAAQDRARRHDLSDAARHRYQDQGRLLRHHEQP